MSGEPCDMWAAVRRAYVDDAVPVRRICETFHITARRLYLMADREGWPRRQQRATPRRAGRPRIANARPGRPGRGAPGERGPSKQDPGAQDPGGPDAGGQNASERDAGERHADRRAALIRRLYRTLEQQMHEIETRLDAASGDAATASAERDARTLSTLTRTLEKLLEMEQSASATPAQKDDLSDRKIDELREHVARKIARLGGAGPASPGSGEPEPG
jgi:hypothetical protein